MKNEKKDFQENINVEAAAKMREPIAENFPVIELETAAAYLILSGE